MAIDEQVELLKQGVRAWNAWRARQPEATVDLSEGALRGLALDGADLSGADLTGADLRGTVLSGADLAGARFQDANLFKAVIEAADLDGADLRGAKFLSCDQLISARNWQTAVRDADLACGAPIPAS